MLLGNEAPEVLFEICINVRSFSAMTPCSKSAALNLIMLLLTTEMMATATKTGSKL